jgi:hypothetical protein
MAFLFKLIPTILLSELLVMRSSIPQGYLLGVAGEMLVEGVTVKLYENWPDYVFEDNHQLMTLSNLEKYINENKRLPGIPSASEIQNNGINLGNLQTITIEKLEELTLYMIELKKENETLKKRVEELEKK